MKSHWLNHNGVRILLCDFSGFGRDVAGLRTEIGAADAEICAEQALSVLALADLTGTVTSVEVVRIFQRSASLTKGFIRAQAIVGLAPFQRILVYAVAKVSGETFHLFTTREQALAWLSGGSVAGSLTITAASRLSTTP